MLLVKCFKQQNNITKRVVDISLELRFLPQEKLCVSGPGVERNCHKTAVLKTVPIIFSRNDCKMDSLPPCLHLALTFTAWFLYCTCFILFLLLPKEVVTLYNSSISTGNDSLLPAELKTKEEGGLVLVRRGMGPTGPRSKKLHMGSFILLVSLIFNRQHPLPHPPLFDK